MLMLQGWICSSERRQKWRRRWPLGQSTAGPVVDIRSYLEAAQIAGFYLEGGQFLDVAQCLEVLQRLRRYGQIESQRVPLLSRRLARLSDFSIVLREIRTALDEKGAVRDHASPALQDIRQRLKRVRDRVHRTLHDLMTTYSSVRARCGGDHSQ